VIHRVNVKLNFFCHICEIVSAEIEGRIADPGSGAFWTKDPGLVKNQGSVQG
jgi:hypothetical protein